jgi:hypothetical protein
MIAGPLAKTSAWQAAPGERLNAIWGQVTRNGQPASYALVELKKNGRALRQVRSDGNGYYGFTTLPFGTFELQVLGSDTKVAVATKLGSVVMANKLELK